MLALALIFILGALVATLGALLLVPLVWRKAQNLAWREAEASLPMSLPEIRAEADKVRAEAAMRIRQQEILANAAREDARIARADAGRLYARGAAPEDQPAVADPAATLAALRASAPADADEIEALNRRLETMDEDSGEQRLLLAAALLRIDQLQAELAAARRQPKAERWPGKDVEAFVRDGRFRAEIEALARLPDDAGNRAAIREKLDDIAVAVTLLAAEDSAPDSRLNTLLASQADVTGRLGKRILRQAHGKTAR